MRPMPAKAPIPAISDKRRSFGKDARLIFMAIDSEVIQGEVKAGLIISAVISGLIGYLWLKRSLVLK